MKLKKTKIIMLLIILAIAPFLYLALKYVKSPSEAYYTKDCFDSISFVPHENFELYLWKINENSSEIYSLVDYFEKNSSLICMHDSSKGEDLRRCSIDHMSSATIIGPVKNTEIKIIPSTITIKNTGLVRSIEGPREKTFIKSIIGREEYWINTYDLKKILEKRNDHNNLANILNDFQSGCDKFITERRSSWKAK